MMEITRTIKYDADRVKGFGKEIMAVPGCGELKSCIQCGTCSGSCPVSWAMEESPRQIIAMIRAGMRDRVLDSTTIWTCASCYSCAVRCPQQIRITDIMYILKRIAIRERRERSRAAQTLSRAFVHTVNAYGRNHETELMARFMVAANPTGVVKAAPIGLKLWQRGRLPLFPRPIRNRAGLRKIIAKAQELGGE